MFHAHQTKTAKEVKQQLDSLKNQRELKAKRKAQQDENVRKKAEKKKGGKDADDYAFEKEGGEGAASDVGDAEANVDEDKQARDAASAPKAGQKRKFGQKSGGGGGKPMKHAPKKRRTN